LRIVSSFCGSCVRAVTVKPPKEVEAQLLVVREPGEEDQPSVMITTEMGIAILAQPMKLMRGSRAP